MVTPQTKVRSSKCCVVKAIEGLVFSRTESPSDLKTFSKFSNFASNNAKKGTVSLI